MALGLKVFQRWATELLWGLRRGALVVRPDRVWPLDCAEHHQSPYEDRQVRTSRVVQPPLPEGPKWVVRRFSGHDLVFGREGAALTTSEALKG